MTALERFLRSVERFPNRHAVESEGRAVTYRELRASALAIAHALAAETDSRWLALHAPRGPAAYAAILGAMAAGRGYVPLGTRYPLERNLRMLDDSGAGALLVAGEEREWLPLLERTRRSLLVLFADCVTEPELPPAARHHRVLPASALSPRAIASLPARNEADPMAYLLFTSGSTGRPKGVAIRQRQLTAYLTGLSTLVDFRETDRFSQNFELTFDLSVHDCFACFGAGATLCVPPKDAALAPVRYAAESGLSVWFSVPSLITVADRLHTLKPSRLDRLRWSLFCGEALSVSSARKWRQAAPNARLLNLYGPTEATIAILHHEWTDADLPCDLVPLGRPFPNQQARLVGEELWLAGSQLADGYWRRPEETRASFVEGGYRTGDRARVDDRGTIHFLGRLDDQIKVQGHRVELREIESVLQRAGAGEALVLALRDADGNVTALEAVVSPEDADGARLLGACAAELPAYMIPKRVLAMASLPRNPNGKLDRSAAARLLEMAPHAKS